MSSANLDSADLKAASGGSLIREDVMNKIFDISRIPLPFTDMIGSTTSKNSYVEWTQDSLAAPVTNNAVVDGSDASGNNTVVGTRVGNQHQISVKVVRVSSRAESSDVIGRTNELAYQLMRRQQELRRDVEATALVNQASVADDGGSTAGLAGGLPSWLATGYSTAGSSGSPAAGGFNTSTKLTVAITRNTSSGALTEALVRSAVRTVYTNGGDPSVLMSSPAVIEKFSAFMLSSSAKIAQIHGNVDSTREEKITAIGSVGVFMTDFGTIRAVPNRLQPTYTLNSVTTCADVFILDPEYLSMCYKRGYQTETLAKAGLAENRLISVDWSLIVHTEKAHAIIANVNGATAMTA